MDSIAYYDGKIGSFDDISIPFNDRSHFFGDGIYEATASANGRALFLEDHLDRMYSSARLFDITIRMSKEEMAEILLDLVSRVEGRCHFLYWQVSRGVALRGHTYGPDMESKLWAYAAPEEMGDFAVPLKLVTAEDKRFEYCNAKTLNLLPAVLYAQKAKRAQTNEAVLHRGDIVTECAHSNVTILKDGVLYTHPNDEYILRGIAKTHLIAACYKASVPVIERAFTLDELFDADEVIVTSSSHPCRFANEIDGQPVGCKDHATLRAIRDVVYKECLDYLGIDEIPC